MLGRGGRGILGCFGGCWFQESDFSWILGLYGDILVAGQCLKPFLDAPWLGAGWLARGLGAQGEPRTGGTTQRWYAAVQIGLGGVARGSFKDFISLDFRAFNFKS